LGKTFDDVVGTINADENLVTALMLEKLIAIALAKRTLEEVTYAFIVS
jgi:hypothetical protein